MIGTVAGADEFHAARGNAAWASATEEAKSAALERAADYITWRYTARYEIPGEVAEKAAYIAALAELLQPGFFTYKSSPNDAPSKVLTKAADFSWTIIGGGAGKEPSISSIEDMMRPYMMSWWRGIVVA